MTVRMASYMAAAIACGLALAATSPALAQPRTKLGDFFHHGPSQPSNPVVGRYGVERGPGFVLDRSSSTTPLLKYENSNEIWVLQPRPAGRGDMIFTNDAGDVVLRATRLGGLIVFSEERPQGAPASLRGAAQPIPTDVMMTPGGFVRRMNDALQRISDLDPNFKKISFNSDDSAAPLLAEAAVLTVQAIQNAVRRKKTKTVETLGAAGAARWSVPWRHLRQGRPDDHRHPGPRRRRPALVREDRQSAALGPPVRAGPFRSRRNRSRARRCSRPVPSRPSARPIARPRRNHRLRLLSSLDGGSQAHPSSTVPSAARDRRKGRSSIVMPELGRVDPVPVRALAFGQQIVDRRRAAAVVLAVAKGLAIPAALRVRLEVEQAHDLFCGH